MQNMKEDPPKYSNDLAEQESIITLLKPSLRAKLFWN